MYNFRFTCVAEIEDILLNSLGTELMVRSPYEGHITYFHNGDTLTVNMVTGEMCWEPLRPGVISSSKLSLRVNQWFGKGIIKTI